MQNEIITPERLQYYGECRDELEHLLNQKDNLIERIGALKSVNYASDKVTNGNSRKISEPERYAIALQTVNKRIEEISAWMVEEGKIILAQINRIIRWEYRKILSERYIQRKKWSEIVENFFEFETDFEEEKEGKYREKVLDWHKAALKQLAEISKNTYIPINEQLHISLYNERNTNDNTVD